MNDKPHVGDIISSSAFGSLENGKGEARYLVIGAVAWMYSAEVQITAIELVSGEFHLSAPQIQFYVKKGVRATDGRLICLDNITFHDKREMVFVPKDVLPKSVL